MIRRPPRSTQSRSSAASDVYKRQRYYQRAANLPGVRFIRSYVSIGKEVPESKNVTIRYATDSDGVKEEEFDLVVLSVGMSPPKDLSLIHISEPTRLGM